MAITKKPHGNLSDITTNAAQVEKFIAGATTPSPAPPGKRVAALIRFDARLLKRIDAAAERRGISRAAWLQFIASRALDAGEG